MEMDQWAVEIEATGRSGMKAWACVAILAFLICGSSASRANAQVPAAIAAAPGEANMVTIHAQGAQIYECKADSGGKSVWQFREPIASLFLDGKTVGRHYAGPTWELTDGSIVVGKVAGRAPGASANDIPLLKLQVVSQRGKGQLTGASAIQRINTKGGTAEGVWAQIGAFLSVPYSADYVFLRMGG
jgi:Protein of unknown function (DUF3455)